MNLNGQIEADYPVRQLRFWPPKKYFSGRFFFLIISTKLAINIKTIPISTPIHFPNPVEIPINTSAFEVSFAELICLEDEATYVDITFKDKGNVKEEIDLFKSVSYDKTIKITYKDIYFRFMCAHEQVYKNSDYPDNIEKAAKAFHKNELNLLFSSKWGFKLKHQYAKGKVWRSYTSEFFTKKNI